MITGVLNVYKEEGMTSHDVVAILRGVFHQKRIGHTGTLDPMATGVLPICLGKATKIADYISDEGKSYIAKMKFGLATDTLDRMGKVVETSDKKFFTHDEIEEAMGSFRGDILQRPPMYSAIKVNGKKLYEIARKGKSIDRKARPITIKKLEIIELDGDELTFECSCSKGTYIRQLAYDLASSLGSCGMLIELERSKLGPFIAADAVSIEKIKNMDENYLNSILWNLDISLPHMQKVIVNLEEGQKLMHGAFIDLKDDWMDLDGTFKIILENEFLGLGYIKDQKLRVKKMLFEG